MIPVEVQPEHLRLGRPYINICGLAININKRDDTFDIDAIQYTSALKEIPRDASVFTARVFIPDTPRYKKNKPMPSTNSFVFVSGFLGRFTVSLTGIAERFYAELDKVAFLGKKVNSLMESTSSLGNFPGSISLMLSKPPLLLLRLEVIPNQN
jgi:hypothetical protein